MNPAIVAIILALAIGGAHAQDSRYGFVRAPGTYDQEYRRNEHRCPPWHPYQPGYHRCSGDDLRHGEDKGESK
jgi:hypothetical protein